MWRARSCSSFSNREVSIDERNKNIASSDNREKDETSEKGGNKGVRDKHGQSEKEWIQKMCWN